MKRGNPAEAGRSRAASGVRVCGRYVKGTEGGVIRLPASFPNRRKTCPTCSEWFVARQRHDQVYCSRRCGFRRHGIGMVEGQCPVCGVTFVRHPNARFCSRKCVLVARGKARLTPIDERACPECGGSFQPRNERHRFCSRVCGWNAYYREYRPLPPPTPCVVCGALIEPKRRGLRLYCSQRCSRKVHMPIYQMAHPKAQLDGVRLRIEEVEEPLQPVVLALHELRKEYRRMRSS